MAKSKPKKQSSKNYAHITTDSRGLLWARAMGPLGPQVGGSGGHSYADAQHCA